MADITVIRTDEGWLYMAVVIDLYARLVVGWSMCSRITRELVMDATNMAIWHRRPPAGPLSRVAPVRLAPSKWPLSS